MENHTGNKICSYLPFLHLVLTWTTHQGKPEAATQPHYR